jgi:hypothetical protein
VDGESENARAYLADLSALPEGAVVFAIDVTDGAVIGSHIHDFNGSYTVMPGCLPLRLDEARPRSVDQASSFREISCDTGLTPPFENELTSDHDEYEDSYQRALDYATISAKNADDLALEWLKTALANTTRADEAKAELHELCGSNADYQPGDDSGAFSCGSGSCSADLANCLPDSDPNLPTYRYEYVAMGDQPLCVFEHRRFGVCWCSPEDDRCQALPCPALAGSADSPESCREHYFTSLSSDDFEVKYVGQTLDLFSAGIGDAPEVERGGSSDEVDPASCSYLHALRQHAADQEGGYSEFRQKMRQIPWLNANKLGVIARSVRLEFDYPNQYTLTLDGRRLASTTVPLLAEGADLDACPLVFPWRADGEVVPERMLAGSIAGNDPDRSFTNRRISCAAESSCAGQEEIYECRYLDVFEGAGRVRTEWADHLAAAMSNLEALGGLVDRQHPVLEASGMGTQFGEAAWNGSNEFLLGYGESWPRGLPIMELRAGPEAKGLLSGESRIGIFRDCCDSRWRAGGGAAFCDLYFGAWEYDKLCPLGLNYCYEDHAGFHGMNHCLASMFSVQAVKVVNAGAVNNDAEDFRQPMGRFWNDALYKCLWGTPGAACWTEPVPLGHLSVSDSFGDRVSVPVPDEESTDFSPANRDALWNALELACWVQEQGVESQCDDSAIDIEAAQDVSDVAQLTECMVDRIHDHASRLIVANVPRVVVDRLKTPSLDRSYQDYSGEIQIALRNMHSALRRTADALRGIANASRNIDIALRRFGSESRLSYLIKEKEVVALAKENSIALARMFQTLGRVIANTNWTNFVKNFGASEVGNAMIAAGAAAEYGSVVHYNKKLEDLADQQAVEQIQLAMTDLARTLSYEFETIESAHSEILESYEDLLASSNGLDSIQAQAARYMAQIGLHDHDSEGRIWATNTVLRRMENTLRVQYYRALDRAVRDAMAARRAVELKFAVRLEEINHDLSFVEAPSRWVNGLCTASGQAKGEERVAIGLDYALITDPEDLPDDHFADSFVSEYVTKLSEFVRSYQQDYPFSSPDGFAVISLGALAAAQPRACWADDANPNLLYFSDALGENQWVSELNVPATRGWLFDGCAETDGILDGCIGLGAADGVPRSFTYCGDSGLDDCTWGSNSTLCNGSGCYEARLVADRPVSSAAPHLPRAAGATSSGYLHQQFVVPFAGLYALRFFVGDASGSLSPVEYGVTVTDVDSGAELIGHQALPGPYSEKTLFFEVERDDALFDVAFSPSSDDCLVADDTNGCEFDCTEPNSECALGEIWLGRVQVSAVGRAWCHGSDDCEALVPPYVQTTYHRGMSLRCEDFNDFDLTQAMRRVCQWADGRPCSPEEEGCPCYRALDFGLFLDDLERGNPFQSNAIAAENYNYRHDALAINLVGEDLLERVSGASLPSYIQTTLPYNLLHHGGAVPLRDRVGVVREFDLPVWRINGGRALANDMFITDTPTSSQTEALATKWESGLRGRPLQGRYSLLLRDEDNVAWGRLRDIHLILRGYRYWTPQGY